MQQAGVERRQLLRHVARDPGVRQDLVQRQAVRRVGLQHAADQVLTLR